MHRRLTSVLVLVLAWFSVMERSVIDGDAMAAVAGAPAPTFELVTFAGEAYNRASLKGQPVGWKSMVLYRLVADLHHLPEDS